MDSIFSYKPRRLTEYQRLLSRFEKYNDHLVMPDTHLILRLDGRRYGASWDSFPSGDYPVSEKVHEAFIDTARDLMRLPYKVILSHVHGDEISILLDISETACPRHKAKLISVVSSATSFHFADHFGKPLLFHAKLSELPSTRHVVDYFMWQRKCAERNYFQRLIPKLLQANEIGSERVEPNLSGISEEERKRLLDELGYECRVDEGWKIHGSFLWWQETNEEPKNFDIARSSELISDAEVIALTYTCLERRIYPIESLELESSKESRTPNKSGGAVLSKKSISTKELSAKKGSSRGKRPDRKQTGKFNKSIFGAKKTVKSSQTRGAGKTASFQTGSRPASAKETAG